MTERIERYLKEIKLLDSIFSVFVIVALYDLYKGYFYWRETINIPENYSFPLIPDYFEYGTFLFVGYPIALVIIAVYANAVLERAFRKLANRTKKEIKNFTGTIKIFILPVILIIWIIPAIAVLWLSFFSSLHGQSQGWKELEITGGLAGIGTSIWLVLKILAYFILNDHAIFPRSLR